LGVAAHGFHQTWSQFSSGDKFLAPVTAAVRRQGAAVRRIADRLLRRHRSVTVQVGLADDVGLTDSVRAVKAYGPLPSIADDPDGFADLVGKRLAELLERVQAVDHRLSDQVAAMQERGERDLRDVRDRLAHIEAISRSVAVGGLREQVFGWALIVVGFTVQGIAQFAQAT